MDKYTKTLLQIIKIPIGIFCALVGIAFIAVSVWVSTFSDVASMIFIASLLGGGCLINFGIGYAFLGDEYKATNIVRDGNTTFTPVTSTKYLQRRKVVTFVGFVSYLILTLYYIVRTILVCVYSKQLQDSNFNTNVFALIVFAIISLVVAVCLLLLYKKTKHVDLKQNEN